MFEGFRSLRKFSIGGTNHKERIEHKKIMFFSVTLAFFAAKSLLLLWLRLCRARNPVPLW
jgi:hypothetical protein